MRRYRISPSLLNSFSDWLNYETVWEKFWGNAETPAMTQEEFGQKQLAELLAYINREPQEPNEAAERGTCLNEIIDRRIGADPNGSVRVTVDVDIYRAERNGFTFQFNAADVDSLTETFRGTMPQYHLSQRYTIGNREVTLHGYSDYLFPDRIGDLKTTGRYESEKYRDNWQRKVYPLVAEDSGAMQVCREFTFYALQCKTDKSGIIGMEAYEESYDFHHDESKDEVLTFLDAFLLPQLDAWLEEGLIPHQTLMIG